MAGTCSARVMRRSNEPRFDKTFPLWIDEALATDSTAGAGTGTPRDDFGNLAIHAIGYALPDVTYHVQQWITQGSQSGGLDTAWLAYHPAFAPDLHLFVGKVLNPAPSPYSQTSDLDGPLASSTVVGEHDWGATYGNRWGTRAAYVGKSLDVEAGYYLTSEDLNGLTDFSPGDKTFQWKVALAQAKSPLEVGVFGSNGTIPVSTGTDVYQSQAGYIQLDPGKNYRPGALLIYQRQSDSNAGMDANGNQYSAAASAGWSAENFRVAAQRKRLTFLSPRSEQRRHHRRRDERELREPRVQRPASELSLPARLRRSEPRRKLVACRCLRWSAVEIDAVANGADRAAP